MDLKQLKNDFPAASLPSLITAIQRAVNVSAKRYPLRLSMKDAEVRRRVRWCISKALMLRKVLMWSNERICDCIPQALDTYLSTGDWQPNDRRMWAANERN